MPVIIYRLEDIYTFWKIIAATEKDCPLAVLENEIESMFGRLSSN